MSDTLLLHGREDQLRAELSTVRRGQFRRLVEECERYRGLALPAEPPPESITYLGAAAANLALAYRLTGQRHYLSELRRWLVPPLSFPHWGKAHMPDHDLDAGWLLHGLGLACAWAGDALPEQERIALRDRLVLQGTRMQEFAIAHEGQWWSSSYWQNHNWICYAGLATAGYAVAAEHEPARDWTELAKANFDVVLDMLPEDGSNNEGVVYWRYGVPWLVTYLDVLRSAEGIDWFPRSDYLRETFWYRFYQAAPDLEQIVDHGDCHDRRSGHPVAMYYKLAAEYRIGQAQWLAGVVTNEFFWREAYESGVRPGVRAEAYQELLWYDPTVVPEGPEELPTSRHFRDLGLVVGRTSWDRDATLLSFKASPGGGHKAWETSHRLAAEKGWTTLNAGHHHPDAGSFVLIGHGSHLAVDEGYSSRKLTGHHNTVLVDGQGFVNEDRYHVYKDLSHEHTAEILTSTLTDGWVHAVSEIGAMYPAELEVERMRRHVVLTPTGRLVVVDDLRATAPRRWTWLLQTDNPAESQVDAQGAPRTWVASAGTGRLHVTALAPEDTTDEVVATAIHANPTSSTPALSIAKTQHTLRRSTAPLAQTQFVTVLQPQAWDDDGAATVELTQSGRAVLLTLTRAGVAEHIAIGLDGQDVRSILADGVGADRAAAASGNGFAALAVGAPTVGQTGDGPATSEGLPRG